jgi:hypothetical protein
MQVAVAPSQFIHQLSQPGRQFGFGADALLQPFADGVADGPAGPVIELLVIAVDLGIHDNSLTSSTSQRSQGLSDLLLGQVIAMDLVSRAWTHAFACK